MEDLAIACARLRIGEKRVAASPWLAVASAKAAAVTFLDG